MLKGTLRTYQLAAVEYARTRRRVLICDEVGLGKTPLALGVLDDQDAFPAIVVVPAYLKGYWCRQVEAWLDGVTWQRLDAGDVLVVPPQRRHVVVTNYDVLDRFVDPIAKVLRPRGIVFDESIAIKNAKAKRSKAARAVARGVPTRLCLTATPIDNKPAELMHQIVVLGQAQVFGSGGTWGAQQRFCNPTPWKKKQIFTKGWRKGDPPIEAWDFNGANETAAFAAMLRRGCMVRRTRKEVGLEIPEKSTTIVPVPLPLDAMDEYQRAELDYVRWLKENDRDVAAALRAEALTKLEALRMIATRGKMAEMFDWVEDFLASGERLVIFTTRTETLKAFLQRFPGSESIYGETPPKAREEIVDRFQAGKIQLLVVNVRAGGTGIELTAAANCLFAELPWTSTALEQAEGRLHRFGQRSPVTSWYFIAAHTVEEDMLALLAEKAKLVGAVLGGAPAERSGADLVAEVSRLLSTRAA